MNIRAVLAVSISVWAGLTQATIINVPEEQTTIQAGINAAADGDTVLVARDLYHENIHFRGKGIVVASHFLLSRDPVDVDSTIIDGSSPANSDSASCVRITNDSLSQSSDTMAALIGFTLTGGGGTRWTDEHGAGTFREGGGILIQYASPRIRFNHIIANHAYESVMGSGGGGIRVGDGNPSIENNTIVNNWSGQYGGGIVLNFTGAMIRNNVIAFDSSGGAYGGGGAIWIYANDPLARPKAIINNTVAFNRSGFSPAFNGGIEVQTTLVDIRNNIIWGNRNRQVRGVTGVAFCDVQGGYAGPGNIDLDPEFLDIHHFYLHESSPCVDAGDSSPVYDDPLDTANHRALFPALGTRRNDMGAYGGPGSAVLPSGIAEQSLNPVRAGSCALSAGQNPVRAPVMVRYSLPQTAYVELLVYDRLGRVVAVLAQGIRPAGMHSALWHGIRANPGVYFLTLHTGNAVLCRKLVLAQ